ncbi:MAG: glucans biosynthesis glucosyltransferase MdoH, partial [Alphaproteobacteria bacterium]
AEIVMSALYAPVMMIAQSHIVWQVLRGGDSGWKPQRRDDGGVPFETAMTSHRWHSVFGVALAWAAWAINPGLFLWTLPVTGALILAPVTSWLSGSRVAGKLLYSFGMLRTPEERRRSRPEILDLRAAELAALTAQRRPEVVSALVTLSEDAELNAWHCRQLENRSGIAASTGFDADLAVAEAKAQRESDPERLSAWLTAPEEIAFLHDSGLVANLLARGQKWRCA